MKETNTYTLKILDIFDCVIVDYKSNSHSDSAEVISDDVAEENLIPDKIRTSKEIIDWVKSKRPNWTIIENGNYILGERKVKTRSYGPKF